MNPEQPNNPDTVLPDVVMPQCPSRNLLRGQKALVTGANSGIGRSVALHLAEEGADVIVNYVFDDASAKEVVDEIKRKGGHALAIKANVADEHEVQSMFASMLEEFGTIDILVNLKTAVEPSKIPFALSLSKGKRDFGRLQMGEHVKAIHASTSSARTAFTRSNCGF
jgi:NAD(P)-dependent dehydrogenase (short-subunit alcohol dehydrogenase family)